MTARRQLVLILTLAIALTIGTLAALAAGSAAAVERAPETMRWTVDGVERQALVFAPAAGAAGSRLPLVLAFHGHGSDMRELAHALAIHDRWPAALVVYPEGLPTVSRLDPQGTELGWQREPGENGDRDLKLVDAILKSLRARYPVDDRRIYATGFSNGAVFTYLLWATRGATFAAFAPCAGVLGRTAHLSVPKPLLHIAGQTDHIAPYPLQLETIGAAMALDGAAAPGTSCGAGCTLFASTKKAPVETIIHPGGHVLPPAAADRIVEFLRAQPASP